MRNFRRKKFLATFIFLAVFAAAIAVVMLLWNALLPAIFGITAINFWQAAGLIILIRILFGGMGHSKHGGALFFDHSMHKRRHAEFFEMHKKMRGMSHSERREFIRQRMTEKEDEGK
jgi:hypothetical protein